MMNCILYRYSILHISALCTLYTFEIIFSQWAFGFLLKRISFGEILGIYDWLSLTRELSAMLTEGEILSTDGTVQL